MFLLFEKYVGKIYPRSSLFLKSVFNTGDRIAQILFGIKEPPKRKCIELSSFDDFVTERNNKGFGSTGV